MSRHRELKLERSNLESEIASLNVKIDGYRNNIRVQESFLSNLDKELNEQLAKNRDAALKSEINKHTFKHSEILRKLQNKRDEILSNRDKKLEKITYENFSKKAKDRLSVEDSVKRAEEINNLLSEKMGKRLSSELSRIIPSKRTFHSLKEIQDAFDELETICNGLKSEIGVLDKLDSMIFSYDTRDIGKNESIVFVVVLVFIALSLMFFMPLFLCFLVFIIVFYVIKSINFYKAMSVSKVLVSNVKEINQSIEDGINNRVKSKRTEVENKFKLILNDVEEKITTVEELISDTTQEVTNDFTFDDSSVIDSFKTKKDSYLDQIKSNEVNVEQANIAIDKIKESISKIDKMIAEEGKTIFESYYPKGGNFGNRSYVYLDDFLIDIVNDEPIIHQLPRGSAVYLYKDKKVMLNFINLWLVSLFTRMAETSLYVKMIDIKYAGTSFIDFSAIETLTQIIDENSVKEMAESLNKEMMKRIKILGSKHIDDYNRFMIEDDSSPLPYYYIFDLFNKPSDNSNIRQVLVNGFKYGISYNLFLDVGEVEGDSNCIEFLRNNYHSYYYVTDSKVSKKSSKFLDVLLEKK